MKAQSDHKIGKHAYFMIGPGRAARKSCDLPSGMNHALAISETGLATGAGNRPMV
jgi:hypothetical protein